MYRSTITVEGLAEMSDVLDPEAEEKIPRSDVRVMRKNGDLIVDIEAEDISALKASLSSYLRWISAIMRAKNIMEE